MRWYAITSFLSVPFAVVLGACSITSAPGQGSGGQDASPPTTIPGDVGKSCSAGCGSDLCVVTSDPECSSGDCLVDSRGGVTSIDSYCTGDCTVAACPGGYACQPVPSALTGQPLQRCVKDGQADDAAVDAPGDAGTGDDAADGGASCGIVTGDKTCDLCLGSNCCAQEQACAASADCLALLQCLQGCAAGDQTCMNDCASQHPSGTTVFNQIPPCAQAHCSKQCGGGAPSIGACFSTSSYTTCDAYCSSVGQTCATTCSGANGGFTTGQAGAGYYSDPDCQSEVSSVVIIVGCSETIDPSNSPSARCCCM